MTTTNLRFVAKNGLDNNGNSIVNLGAIGASLALAGANALTITTTGPTNVTFPTSGTLATLASSVANATTANTLATPRTINGVSFDGSANITIVPSTVANATVLGTSNAAASLIGVTGSNAPMTISAGPNSANGNGNSLTISAGAGVGPSGSGGSLTISSGNTGTTGSGAAGNITIHADNTGGGTTGGTIAIRGGNTPSNSAAGGSVTISGGNSTNGSTSGAGGNVTLAGGTSATATAGSLFFNTANTERMRISNTGALLFAGTAGTAGQVLTTNASGIPSWTTNSGPTTLSATGVASLSATTSGLYGGTPGSGNGGLLIFTTSVPTTGNRVVTMSVDSAGTFGSYFANDTNSSATAWLSVARSANTATSISLTATTVNISSKITIGNSITVGSTPSEGTTGQVLTSAGPGNPPTWSNPGASGSTLKGRVYLNSAANSTTAGWQKVPVATVQYDTASIWNSTNNRFIPNQSGYYQINGRARFGTAGVTALAIAKNGTQTQGIGGDSGSTSVLGEGGSGMIFCNGTTDYIELFVYATASRAFTTGSFDTYIEIYGPL